MMVDKAICSEEIEVGLLASQINFSVCWGPQKQLNSASGASILTSMSSSKHELFGFQFTSSGRNYFQIWLSDEHT